MAPKPKRRAVSQKVRFEVFKRDSFCCQYCGQSAPDVILEVDHIKPIAGGGDNEITNLITSCRDCNSGKGARPLDDKSVLEKQRKQLEELNERRNQLEMMLKWREGLSDITEQYVSSVESAISRTYVFGLNDFGRQSVRKWLKKYTLDEILAAVETSFDQYVEWDREGKPTHESWNKAFDYVTRIISVSKRSAEKPYMRDLYYIRGILRNRLNYVREDECMNLLERAYLAGATVDSLREFAKSGTSWMIFSNELMDFIDDNEVE